MTSKGGSIPSGMRYGDNDGGREWFLPIEDIQNRLSRGYCKFTPMKSEVVKISLDELMGRSERLIKQNTTQYNPEIHNLIYDDGCMIEYWKEEDGVVTIYQRDLHDDNDCGFVCVELSELKKIVEKCEESK